MADLNRWLELESFAEDTRAKYNVPGLSIGVLADGEILTSGFGVRHAEQGTPVWGETLFQIGSISKTFTAALVMKAVEEDLLDLDRPVRDDLPDFSVADPGVSKTVTLRHLLTHSGGWDGDLFLDTGEGADALPKYVARMADREQLFEIGDLFSYNNAGFAVLGAVLEKVHDKPYEHLVRERIFKPLGMDRAFLSSGEVIAEDFTVGHHEVDGEIRVARPWHLQRAVLPVGGIITDAGDLMRYAAGLMGADSGVLSPDSIEALWTPQMPIYPPEGTSVGLSWMRRDLDGGWLVHHGGGTNGQVTLLTLVPEHRFAVAVLTNLSTVRPPVREITNFALEAYTGLRYTTPTEIESTPEALASYAGTASRPGFDLHLTMMGGHLVGLLVSTVGFPSEDDPPFPPERPFRVGRCEEDRLMVLEGRNEGVAIDVIRGEDGEIEYLRLASRVYGFSK